MLGRDVGWPFFCCFFCLRKVEPSKHAGSQWVLPDFMFITCLEDLVIIFSQNEGTNISAFEMEQVTRRFFFIIRCGGSLLSTNNSCRYWFLIFMVKQLLRTARLEILFLWLYCCKFLVAVLIPKHSSWVRCLTRVYHLHDMYSLHPRVTPICWTTIMWACIYTKMNQKVLQQKWHHQQQQQQQTSSPFEGTILVYP